MEFHCVFKEFFPNTTHIYNYRPLAIPHNLFCLYTNFI